MNSAKCLSSQVGGKKIFMSAYEVSLHIIELAG